MYNIKDNINAVAQETNAFSLADCGAKLNLTIRTWTGVIKDKRSGDELVKDAQSDKDAFRVRKNLLAGHDNLLKEMTSKASEVRKYIGSKGIAWLNSGELFFPTPIIPHIEEYLSEQKAWFENKRDEFLVNYVDVVLPAISFVQAGKGLGHKTNLSEYPSVETLRGKFSFDTFWSTVSPNADVPLSGLTDSLKTHLSGSMVSGMNKVVDDAYAKMWHNLHDRVKTLITNLDKSLGKGEKKARLYASLLSNITELCNDLEYLNIKQDQKMEQARQDLLAIVSDYDIDTLRDSVSARTSLRTKVNDFASKFDI